MWNKRLGIDLGTATTLIYVHGKGIVLNEPSVVALAKNSNKILAIGRSARDMIGKTPEYIVAHRPLKSGVIDNYEITRKMLTYFIKQIAGRGLFKPDVVVCVPSGGTEVEKRAILDAAYHAGARKAYLIEEPMAAALGAGLDITSPSGSMVIDVGGGTTDVAILSLGGIVVSRSVRVAGDQFDEAIIRHLRKKFNLLIGEKTAETIKIQIGCAVPPTKEETIALRGRDLISGLPRDLTLTSSEVYKCLLDSLSAIVETARMVLEHTPPELAADVGEKGICLTGGGALLRGIEELVSKSLGTPAYVAEDPISCVALGAGKVLDNIKSLQDGFLFTKRRNG
ncbi:MAG: rod shape-determining protein MreB [Candidatus Atribacteria bacterium]|nr:rod shape-determining protein MreB [Candidatus Atribacteria bacterium]